MVYWEVDQINGGPIERMYGSWEGHQREYHDRLELGDRAAEAFLEQNPVPSVA